MKLCQRELCFLLILNFEMEIVELSFLAVLL